MATWVLAVVSFYSIHKPFVALSKTTAPPRVPNAAANSAKGVLTPIPTTSPLPVVILCGDGKVYTFSGEEAAAQFEEAAKQVGAATVRLVAADRMEAFQKRPATKQPGSNTTHEEKLSYSFGAGLRAVVTSSAHAKMLWNALLIKVLHDEAKAIRLVEFELDERKRAGRHDVPLAELIQMANERWERDNR